MLSILSKAPATSLLFSPLAKISCNIFLHPVPTSQRCLTVNFSNSSLLCNKVVFISQSNDVFSNLALEAWLYKNWSFDRRRLLLLWRNSPCVVMGRHQNPFKEANLSYLESAEVPLARRHSGGGAVYHDHGNLNCTFFSNRLSYNRRWNLELVCHCLRTDFNLDVQLNSRDDILIGNDLKVSGSAAKLGRETAYHHCTLLVDTEKSQLSLTLRGDQSLESTATASVPNAVGSLRSAVSCSSLASPITVSEVLQNLSSRYLEAALPGQQHDPRSHLQASHGVTLVSPQEDWFPGIDELREELTSWSWLYGKTPRFSKSVSVSIPEHLRSGAATATLLVRCERGLVQEVTLDERDPASAAASAALKRAVSVEVTVALRGTPYTTHLPDTLAALLRLPVTGAHSVDKIKI